MTSKIKENKKHTWTSISCKCTAEEEELCSWIFFQYDTLGVESENLDQEKLTLTAFFADNNQLIKNLEQLRLDFDSHGLHNIAKNLTLNTIEEEDWLHNWKKHFEPFTIADKFLICPPWKIQTKIKKENTDLVKIIIDPGMAFGTGLHATTKFCLTAMHKYAKGPNILDVGTGSGILSIAYALLQPASHIVAIDMDEFSIENATHNIELNNVQKQIELIHTEAKEYSQQAKTKFNTILSNITAEFIIDLFPEYNKLLLPGGNLVLAGIIEERLNLVEAAVAKFPFKLIEKNLDNNWVGLVYNKV